MCSMADSYPDSRRLADVVGGVIAQWMSDIYTCVPLGRQNALEAMPQGGTVHHGRPANGRTQVQLHVQDTGSGIVAEQRRPCRSAW